MYRGRSKTTIACCYCGRELTSPVSISRGCGSFCYSRHGPCRSAYKNQRVETRVEPDTAPISSHTFGWKLTRNILIGAGLAVSCAFIHAACAAMLFLHKHEILRSLGESAAALLVRRRNEAETVRKALTTSVEYAGEIGTEQARTAAAKLVGTGICEVVGANFGVSKELVNSVAVSTADSAMKEGIKGAIDWGSKMVVS